MRRRRRRRGRKRRRKKRNEKKEEEEGKEEKEKEEEEEDEEKRNNKRKLRKYTFKKPQVVYSRGKIVRHVVLPGTRQNMPPHRLPSPPLEFCVL